MVLKNIKNIVKKILPITINIRYDNQTNKIMKIVLEADSTFIDVGCHKGEVLDQAIQFSPMVVILATNPFDLYCLAKSMRETVKLKILQLLILLPTEFHHVVSNPAYSGIKKDLTLKRKFIK